MTIDELTATLEERGVAWQGSGFALIGAVSLFLLWVYSEADHWSIGVYRLAVTQLNWAFVVAIAVIIEGVRQLFETRTEIRKRARQKAIAKAFAKGEKRGEKRARERIKMDLREQGIELSTEMEKRLLGNGRDNKWWNRVTSFRSR
ncbi:MAG: hypothetical protein OXC83_09540 [Chloroflexi bacterium]|nr:hypothetical protein [Chloroflexota bacterium]